MCGIAGYFGGPPSVRFIDHALGALASRGPDGSGVWNSGDGTVALVHTRLAILDLSEASSQPMEFWEKLKFEKLKTEIAEEDKDLIAMERSDMDRTERDVPAGDRRVAGSKAQRSPGSAAEDVVSGRLSVVSEEDEAGLSSNSKFRIQNSKSAPAVLVFNGEIYNYRELRRELEAAGEVFASEGDTEVLLRLLVREGAACLPKLAGMFAFAFWNPASGEALLARDSLGIKPLYYREGKGALAFASECKVLYCEGDPIDAAALRDYFLWGSVPDPQTLHLPIRQLPAGHLLKWKHGSVSIDRWHRQAYGKADIGTQSFRVSLGGLSPTAMVTRIALEESMVRHLVSDVPVGIFLSGGIDSTVLLVLARKALGATADIRTFSIGFEDPAFDESSIARRTAEHFGALHTEWIMTPEEGAAEIPAFLKAMDQPGIDGFNTWCVSKLARREGMKVVLSGLGGDELFAGYGSFRQVPRFHRLHRGLGPLRGQSAALMERRAAGSRWRRLADYLRGDGQWLHAYHAQRGIFTAAEGDALIDKLVGGSLPALNWDVPDLPSDPREVVAQLELTRYMRHQLLRDSDVYSMAHSLELRVPFVDSRLIDTILEIPPTIRLQQGKTLLLEAVPEVPAWVRNQTKRGFRFPFQQWMEGQFGALLASAQNASPVPLNAWYRTWAVAAGLRAIQQSDAL